MEMTWCEEVPTTSNSGLFWNTIQPGMPCFISFSFSFYSDFLFYFSSSFSFSSLFINDYNMILVYQWYNIRTPSTSFVLVLPRFSFHVLSFIYSFLFFYCRLPRETIALTSDTNECSNTTPLPATKERIDEAVRIRLLLGNFQQLHHSPTTLLQV